jgi:adenylate kinase
MTTAKNKFLIMLGSQGSGKGTQAAILAKKYGLANISSGEIFRDNLINKSMLGLQAKSSMETGKLVPDEITNSMLAERIRKPDAKSGFILDGYPRNLVQAKYLDTIQEPDKVIELKITDKEAIKRISNRRLDKETGRIISLDLLSPEQKRYYAEHGDRLVYREDDDKPEAVRQRLAIYHKTTSVLTKYYSDQEKLISINGAMPVAAVATDIEKQLNK